MNLSSSSLDTEPSALRYLRRALLLSSTFTIFTASLSPSLSSNGSRGFSTPFSYLASMKGMDVSVLNIGIVPNSTVTIDGLVMSSEEFNSLLTSIMNFGYIIVIILALVFQFGALSMAQEKEEKTFEVLLSQPVPRVQIGLAKVIGAVIMSLI